MPRLLPQVFLLAAFVLAGFVRLSGADAPVVQLPKITVTEKSLEEREHWRYTEIDGFEILSQASDAKLQQLVEELELLPLITKTVWPGPLAMQRAPTAILLCGSDKLFASFVPASVRKAIDSGLVDRLFFKDETKEVIVFDSDKMGNDGRFKEILRDYARRCFLTMKQPPPDWFVTGMAEIIADADYQVVNGQLKIQYAGLLKPPRGVAAEDVTGPDGSLDLSMLGTTVAPPTLYETEKPSPAVREIIRGSLDNRSTGDLTAMDAGRVDHQISHLQFNAYFRQKPFHASLIDILNNKPSLNPDEYRMTCWAFVHLCAFGEQRRYGPPFAKFLTLAVKNPSGDMGPMFREAFGKNTRDMETTISEYCDSASSLGQAKQVPFTESVPVITDAEAMLIGRIKADAYRLGGHPDEAEAELAKARRLAHGEAH